MIKETAYAKINLFLEVRDKREDGYHNIESVMQTVSLCDELYFERSEKTSFGCNVDELCTKDNICLKASRAFAEAFGKGGAKILLEKSIPWGSGLGGGSADAAAVLRGLSRLYHLDVPERDINKLAAKIGADVPFCIHGGTALCQGIGDKIKPVEALDGVYIVIAEGEEKVSTALAYAQIDGLEIKRRRTPKKMLSSLKNGDLEQINDALFNRFEEVYSKSGAYKIMSKNGVSPLLSGSGSSVFAIYKTKEEADGVADALKSKGITSFVVTPVSQY